MPRVTTQRKSNRGKARVCGRCRVEIKPGDTYRKWAFRFGGTHVRCMRDECRPRRSELTQSKLSDVFAAIEGAEADIAEARDAAAIEEALEIARDEIQAVADEYREAAEAMGEAGYENEERAEEIEAFVDALEEFDFDEGDDLDDVAAAAQDILDGCEL